MDLINYLGLRVHIVLKDTGYYFVGKCVEAGTDFLTIIDKFGDRVSLAGDTIASIKEVK